MNFLDLVYNTIINSILISLGDRAGIYYIRVMRNPFETQPARFVSSPALDHPSLQGIDDTEVVLDWTWLEALMQKIYTR